MDKNKDKNLKNPNMYRLVRAAHGLMESSDVEKQRSSQSHVAGLINPGREVRITEIEMAGMQAERMCLTRPHFHNRVILYIHGGGFSTGSKEYSRSITGKLASLTSMDVYSFDYRLAPESMYPSQLVDCLAAWDHLMLQGYGAGDVFVAGDSAGGNLALTLVLSLKNSGRMLPGGVIVFSPWTDLAMTGSSYKKNADIDPVLSVPYLKQYREHYLGKNFDKVILKTPEISPLYGEFDGFPPTHIQVGTAEILYSDSELLHKKMKQQNVDVSLEVFQDMFHVFQMSPFPAAHEAVEKAAEFIIHLCER